MQTERLEQTLMDMIKEQQLKLGFLEETIRLYYPLSTLNHFVDEPLDCAQMLKELRQFCHDVSERLGEAAVSHKGDRFCIQIPPEGAVYVHEYMGDTQFLRSLIETVAGCGCTWEDIDRLFEQVSDSVCVQQMQDEEFDRLYYFKNEQPDAYYYCFRREECHMIYHRFLPEDYKEMYG